MKGNYKLSKTQKKKFSKKINLVKNLTDIKDPEFKTHEGVYVFDSERPKYLNSKRYDRLNKFSRQLFSKQKPSRNIGSYYQDVWNSYNFTNVNKTQQEEIQEKGKRVYVEGEKGEDERYFIKDYKNETLDDLDMEVHVISHSHIDPGWRSTFIETNNCKFFLLNNSRYCRIGVDCHGHPV